MRSDAAALALYTIRDNILAAREFVSGMSVEAFRASKLHVYGVTRALEIISEASRRLTDEVKSRHPDLPWRAIRDVGNLYRHEYDNVVEDYLWETVQNHLGALFVAVTQEIDRLGDGAAE